MHDRPDGESWRPNRGGEFYPRTLQAEPRRVWHYDWVPAPGPTCYCVDHLSSACQYELRPFAGQWTAEHRQCRESAVARYKDDAAELPVSGPEESISQSRFVAGRS